MYLHIRLLRGDRPRNLSVGKASFAEVKAQAGLKARDAGLLPETTKYCHQRSIATLTLTLSHPFADPIARAPFTLHDNFYINI